MNKITFRKRLFALAVCVFTWVGVNAYEYTENNTVLEVYPSDVANSFNNYMFADIPSTVTTVKLVGTFPNGWTSGWLQDGSTSGKGRITTIDLSAATIPATASWSFCSFRALKNIIWPKNDHPNQITVLPGYAFKNTGLETVSIPGYIQRIKSQAFDVDSGEKLLKTIYFEEFDRNGDGTSDVSMVIERQGFSNTSGLVDVYVLANGTLSAENNAFPEVITYGQGDTSRALTRLHFPEDKAEDYVNQTHKLTQDIASDDGKFQAWLVEHYSKANNNGTPNGWYEFVSSGSNPPTEDKDWGDVVLRTFSHPTIDYVVPKGAKAYIVNNVSKSTDSSGDKYTLTLKKVNVIPHGTGVILYGGTNYSNTYIDKTTNQPVTKRTIEMMAVKFDGDPYTVSTTGGYRNFLVSTSVDAEGNPTLAMDGITVKPYDTDNSGRVTHRNFFMGKFRSTNSGKKYIKEHPDYTGNFVGFFRAIESNIAARKAYLSLPHSYLDAETCGEIIVPADVDNVTINEITIRSYRVEHTEKSKENAEIIFTEAQMKERGYWYKNNGQSEVSIEWTDDWGTRIPGLVTAKFEGEPIIEFEEMDGVATLVVPASMVEQEDTDSYYTLQGVKVSNPSKGVYIKNGKKVIIK